MRIFLLLFPLFIILSFLFIFIWWNSASQPVDKSNDIPQRFVITKGQSAEKVSASLKESDLIKDAFAFRIYAQLTGKAGKIQAGNYTLTSNIGLSELLSLLLQGPKELWVTYPEGLRHEEIAIKTIQTLGMEADTAKTFYNAFLKETEEDEGFLFPDTYLFPRDVQAAIVAAKLRSTFDTKVTSKMISDARDAGMSINQVITLASIVERETLTDEERPIVAGVLLARMEIGMPLQTDATLQYITGTQRCTLGFRPDCDWWEPPTLIDKETRSAYNTYTNGGLPPAPIANPGLQSIKAVIYPEESSYLYYIHDKDGKIHYAATIEEHNGNVNEYLR